LTQSNEENIKYLVVG